MSTGLLLLVTAALLCSCHGSWHYRGIGIEPGPDVQATKGEVWPKVQSRILYSGFLVLRLSAFNFQVTDYNCQLMKEAMKRYHHLILKETRNRRAGAKLLSYKNWLENSYFNGYLDSLQIQLLKPCESMPSFGMDERYELNVNVPGQEGEAVLKSQSIWGILRGLETFSQLLTSDDDGIAMIINSTSIVDFPRFPHRGLMLDTSRHFLPLRSILSTLDAMEYNKFNVFHWHIVDDQSFPYQSKLFPMLSMKGAYNPTIYVYTRDDIQFVTEYARLRGIRVLPEFDTPGHTRSWGEGLPDLLTQCYEGDEPDGSLGPMNPIKNNTYEFLSVFFSEVIDLFPEKYVHLGGDEVSFDCWESNPEIQEFMEKQNMTGHFTELEEMYVQRLVDIVTKMNASSVVWQEVFDNGVQLQSDTVVHVWKGGYKEELQKVTEAGHPVLLSSCWYLDHLATGGDWRKYYSCDPHDFDGTEEQKKKVMGGEACMWGEVVDESNVISRVWPRASATAEKLWSAEQVTDQRDAARRLEEHTCRLKRRGIKAQPPNGPGFCPP